MKINKLKQFQISRNKTNAIKKTCRKVKPSFSNSPSGPPKFLGPNGKQKVVHHHLRVCMYTRNVKIPINAFYFLLTRVIFGFLFLGASLDALSAQITRLEPEAVRWSRELRVVGPHQIPPPNAHYLPRLTREHIARVLTWRGPIGGSSDEIGIRPHGKSK